MMKIVKSNIKKVLAILGYQTTPKQQTYEYSRAQIIKDKRIDLIIDVGANIGQYATAVRSLGYENKITSFEPIPEEFEKLSGNFRSDDKWEGVNSACGSENATLDFHVSPDSVCSSLSNPSNDLLDAIPSARASKSIKVKVIRIDDWAEKIISIYKNPLLKIDVQGFELEVLKGAQETLKKCAVLEIELSISNTYENAFDIARAIPYINDLGFKLVSFSRGYTNPRTGALLDGDFLFVKENSANTIN